MAFATPVAVPLDVSAGRRRHCCPSQQPTVASAARQKRQQRRQNGAVKEKQRPQQPSAAGARRGEDHDGTGVPQDILNCCVKLYVTHASPNFSMPWGYERQTSSTSTGFIIQGRRILTCAHCVEHATVVMVKRRGCDVKHFASVAAVGNECDTATLVVGDHSFWDDMERAAAELGELAHLEPGPLPALQEECAVLGFPSPGESICVTQGVCSRAEVSPYAFSTMSHLLAVQLDAAINGGNSGGPVIDQNCRCAGIAFQSIDASENESVGYFVPMLIVQHFLRDVDVHNGKYTGFPAAGFRFQKLENKSMRRALGLDDANRNGILVKAVDVTSDAARVLRRGDIVTALDCVPVSNSGTVPFPEQLGERIDHSFLITSRYVGDSMKVEFMRDGESREGTYALPAMGSERLVPNHAPRQYIVWGGLVFIALSEPYLVSEFEQDFYASAPLSLLNAYYHGRREADGGRQEVVVLAQVLSSSGNAGYEDARAVTLHTINGQAVRSLAHAAELLDAAEADGNGEYVQFETDHKDLIILSKAVAAAESAALLETHAIPAPRLLAGR